MSLYLDTSALLKRYLDEPDSAAYGDHLDADPIWCTARITYVEARRNLAARLDGDALVIARARFEDDWQTIDVVEVDAALCAAAATLAESQALRSLDALHLAACDRVRDAVLSLVTADRRQVEAARSLGWSLLTA